MMCYHRHSTRYLGETMNLVELRKVFKENELKHYEVFPKERKIVLTFDNNHTLSIELEGHPGINHDWDESIVVRVDDSLIARS